MAMELWVLTLEETLESVRTVNKHLKGWYTKEDLGLSSEALEERNVLLVRQGFELYFSMSSSVTLPKWSRLSGAQPLHPYNIGNANTYPTGWGAGRLSETNHTKCLAQGSARSKNSMNTDNKHGQ